MQSSRRPIFEMDKIPVPTNLDQANENLERLAATSRRSFLGQGLATTAAGSAVALASTSMVSAATRTPSTGSTSGVPSLYPGSTTRYFQEIQRDEATHVNIIIQAIQSLGGTPRPYPTFTGISNLSASLFTQTASAFENTGVSAYFAAAPYVQNPAVVSVALSIALTEAYHASFVNTTNNLFLVPGYLPYAAPLTIAQVTAAAAPYIVSLNDNGQFPATFSTTPSAQNDIDILNFALLLEFLEATFYYNNVPRLFR